MERIPPEIWLMIFDNLESSSDLRSVSRTNVYWNSLLHPTKATWIFNLIFPLLLKYLSKQDILQCRLVCRRWCYAVENFLENNSFHRPALYFTEESKRILDSECNDLRHDSLHKMLKTKGLIYNSFTETEKLETFLREASNHTRCPLLGKSASVRESTIERELAFLKPLNHSFFAEYGNHLYYLNISLEAATLIDNLQRIFMMTCYAPNLKKLQIKYCTGYFYDNERTRRAESNFSQFTSQLLKINQAAKTQFPVLETLHVETTNKLGDSLNRALLHMFCTDKLKSLTVFPLPGNLDADLKIGMVTDLSFSVGSDSQLQSLLMFSGTLKRVSVTLSGEVDIGIMFEGLSKFKSSLVIIAISFHPEFYPSAGWAPKLSTFYSPFESRFNRYSLVGFESLKKICQTGVISPSLNFMCAVNKSLEYLEINIKNLEYWSPFLEVPAKDGVERLDLYNYLKLITSNVKGSQVQIYKSNVWTLFPKLKLINVHLENDHGQGKQRLEFRRDVYDRMNIVI